ncbi:HdeD family acid-resistance protein [Janthinobacterium fluminis]|uniref:HdeD family acid-resistance protein n=1 Tax=Janthinobacterium fluminis TaxID=2987524 RepID=A0ABT5K5T5_9BURK|nr:HdeD family acid-resistance protein [Janthinobacterium fluminis]MDC8760146.1 HdeD family acid-resistance protein [Janthinobacterium fluminis]
MSSLPMLMRSWWILALRGAIAVLFGLFALATPGVTLLSLIAVFAVYALLAGAVAIAGALRNRRGAADWWLLLLMGLVSVGAGVLAARHPALTVLALLIVIGVNAIVTGVLDLALAVRLRKVIGGEWLLILSAATAIVFGLLILAYPGAGALVLVWLIGAYALLTGLLYLALAYRAYSFAAPRPAAQGGAAPEAAPKAERRVAERRMKPAAC